MLRRIFRWLLASLAVLIVLIVALVVIGSAGGALRAGRAVRLGSWAGKTGAYWRADAGVPHNRLLATLANAMDVPMEGFGSSKYAGVLPELRAW